MSRRRLGRFWRGPGRIVLQHRHSRPETASGCGRRSVTASNPTPRPCRRPDHGISLATRAEPASGSHAASRSPVAAQGRCLRKIERFPAKWTPVRVKKTRQIKNLEPRSDSIGTEKVLVSDPGAKSAFWDEARKSHCVKWLRRDSARHFTLSLTHLSRASRAKTTFARHKT
jgi:hypothetical protein